MSSLTGFFRETDLFFYRHSVPNGTHNPVIMRSSLVGGTMKQSGYYQLFPDCFTPLPMTKFCNCRIISPVRDGMSVENIPHPVSNPVRDAMSVGGWRHTGIIPDGILSGERFAFLPTFRECLERPDSSLRTKWSNPEMSDSNWIASSFLLAMTKNWGF
jgi:hypothetical protein